MNEFCLVWLLLLTVSHGFWVIFDYKGSMEVFKQISRLERDCVVALKRSDYGNKKASDAVELVHMASNNGKKRYYEVLDRLGSLERYLNVLYQDKPVITIPVQRHIKLKRRKT